ncbi:polygalacturonase ADPG2-like [Miscanthus floridulus]|uniref:polygalacturonase ADPG2-like n=1 Tax=Miscanthus floridulus TaxID=154761 RepID=UPI00345B27D6
MHSCLLALSTMASRTNKPQLQLVLWPSLLTLLFLSSALEAAAGTGTSTSSVSSIGSSADGAPAATGRRSLAAASQSVFSLDRYGARGDGSHDDTQALAQAWNEACTSPRPAVLLVPGGKRYLLKLVTLHGPCKSSVTVTVKGTLVASPNRSDWSDEDRRHWIVFRQVDWLTVNGGGAVDGNGETWWKTSCKTNKALPCKEAPTALSFHFCTSLRVQDLKVVDSQQIHVSIEDCTGVQLTGLSITAPGTSPNTDGIHITRSNDVQVTNCEIKTGDDCLSIESGTHNLHVSQVVCGPGHGISIGSLGDDNSRAEVSGITIDSVQLYGTTNGARIKTYQGGSGYAKDITFQNMVMYNVTNPIIIDQNYCDKATPCEAQGSAVEISNVVFKNIRGTTVTMDAIQLNCSNNVPCHGITLQNINLKMQDSNGKDAAKSTCQNARWRKCGTVLPQPCTSKN